MNILGAADAAASAAVEAGALVVKDTLLDVGTTVLPFAAAILALTGGWRFAKRFIR